MNHLDAQSRAIPFAAAVAVGPGPREVDRLRDLAESLAAYAASPGWLVMIDDHEIPRALDREIALPPNITPVSLHHPRHGKRVTFKVGKGICSAILLSLQYIQRETNAAFVLKLDTDSLVIGPFVERLLNRFAQDVNLAIVGAHRVTPTGEPRDWSAHARRFQAMRRPPFNWRQPLARFRAPHGERKMILDLHDRAVRHGYDSGEHCMGGGYAVSRAFLDRASAARMLADPERWMSVDLPEDVVVSLHARALGMTLADAVAPGDVFGVRYVGLPGPPQQLVDDGYAVIHAVKNDAQHSEESIRRYFRERRKSTRPAVG